MQCAIVLCRGSSALGDLDGALIISWSHLNLAKIIGENTPLVAVTIIAGNAHAVAFIIGVHRPFLVASKKEPCFIFAIVCCTCSFELLKVELSVLVFICGLEDSIGCSGSQLGSIDCLHDIIAFLL